MHSIVRGAAVDAKVSFSVHLRGKMCGEDVSSVWGMKSLTFFVSSRVNCGYGSNNQ